MKRPLVAMVRVCTRGGSHSETPAAALLTSGVDTESACQFLACMMTRSVRTRPVASARTCSHERSRPRSGALVCETRDQTAQIDEGESNGQLLRGQTAQTSQLLALWRTERAHSGCDYKGGFKCHEALPLAEGV